MIKLYPLAMLISGGQSGVDRQALDFAIKNKIPHGGWCPAGRRAEDGMIPDKYNLKEASTPLYQQRTRLNVRDSDATLIIHSSNHLSRGCLLTCKCAIRLRRPFFPVNCCNDIDINSILAWLWQTNATILNIAGSRHSEMSNIKEITFYILKQTITTSNMPKPQWPPSSMKTGNLFKS